MTVDTMSLPPRAGAAPKTSDTNPHSQLEQNAPQELQDRVVEMAAELEGVGIGKTGVPEWGGQGAVPNTRAFILDPALVHGPRQALLVGTEFGHVHPEHDGSLHLCLPDDLHRAVLEAGWGEPHPLAGRSVKGFDVPAGNTLIFGPRDEGELETVWTLVQAAYDYACGDPADDPRLEQVRQMTLALDAGDADAFSAHFTAGARFRFGNAPAVFGRDEVRAAVAAALDPIAKMRHSIVGVWGEDDVVVAEFAIDFTRPDGDVITLPCASIMRHEGNLVRDYRVNMDMAPVFRMGAKEDKMSTEETLAAQRATVLEHIAAENEGRMDDVYETFLDGPAAHFDVVPLGSRYPGREGVVEFYEYMFGAFGDMQITITSEAHSVGVSAIEVSMEGTHQSEFLGIEPTGTRVAFEASAFFIFDEEEPAKLVCERVYFDVGQIVRQVKGEVSEPELIGLDSNG